MHENYINKIKPTKKIRFREQNLVRIARTKPTFGLGYDKKSPEEIYRITKIRKKFPRVLYEIETLDGENVIGFFIKNNSRKSQIKMNMLLKKFCAKIETYFLLNSLAMKNPNGFIKKMYHLIKTFSNGK